MRGKCVGKVTTAPGVWPEQSETTSGSSVLLLHLDTTICLLLSPVYSPSLLCWPLLSPFIYPYILTCYCFLSVIISLILLLTPALFPPLRPHLILCMSLLYSYCILFLSPVSLPVSLSLSFFMSFWPRSHFPNWLSGSLIILRHPCCRLFYLSACRHPNPLISKYPSSAHIALQQPSAFLVYFSIVHTDSPYTLSHSTQ